MQLKINKLEKEKHELEIKNKSYENFEIKKKKN